MTPIQVENLAQSLPRVIEGLRAGEQFVLCDGEQRLGAIMPFGDVTVLCGLDATSEDDVASEAFDHDLDHVLEKNAELYRRLAQ